MMHVTPRAAAHLHALTANEQRLIGTVLADAGYAANLTAPGPDRLIALG